MPYIWSEKNNELIKNLASLERMIFDKNDKDACRRLWRIQILTHTKLTYQLSDWLGHNAQTQSDEKNFAILMKK